MKKDSAHHTSQDRDRKNEENHIANNPRAIKDLPNSHDSGVTDQSPQTAEIIARGHTMTGKPSSKSEYAIDERKLARQEHTNHFTSRGNQGNKS